MLFFTILLLFYIIAHALSIIPLLYFPSDATKYIYDTDFTFTLTIKIPVLPLVHLVPDSLALIYQALLSWILSRIKSAIVLHGEIILQPFYFPVCVIFPEYQHSPFCKIIRSSTLCSSSWYYHRTRRTSSNAPDPKLSPTISLQRFTIIRPCIYNRQWPPKYSVQLPFRRRCHPIFPIVLFL